MRSTIAAGSNGSQTLPLPMEAILTGLTARVKYNAI
jgi:hypothetical protein